MSPGAAERTRPGASLVRPQEKAVDAPHGRRPGAQDGPRRHRSSGLAGLHGEEVGHRGPLTLVMRDQDPSPAASYRQA